METTRVHLLGGFELRVAERVVDVQPAAQRVVAMVALAPRSIGRSYVAGQLWPDYDESRAHGNLRSALWRLGRVAPDTVRATKSTLQIGANVWVDVRDEGAHRDDAAQRHRSPSLIEPSPFEGIMDGLLPDWYDDWLIVERERLRQRRVAEMEAAARSAIDDGDCARGIQWALAAVAAEPLRESAHRLVIEAHLEEHNQSAALAALSQYRRLLLNDPGIVPSPDLVRLVEREHAPPLPV